jgi:hypothetical protein
LDGEIRKISGQCLCPCKRAIQEHGSRASLGAKVLEQEASHASRSNDGHLFLIQRDKVLDTAGLGNFQLGQLHRSRADRDGPRAEVRFGTNPFPRADRLIQKTIQNGPNGAVLLAQPDHLLDLGEDLPFPQHQAVQARRNPKEMSYSIGVMVGEEVGGEFLNPEP